jgi:hypothetical protein
MHTFSQKLKLPKIEDKLKVVIFESIIISIINWPDVGRRNKLTKSPKKPENKWKKKRFHGRWTGGYLSWIKP